MCLLELGDLQFEFGEKLPVSKDNVQSSSGPVYVKDTGEPKGQGRKCQVGNALESSWSHALSFL